MITKNLPKISFYLLTIPIVISVLSYVFIFVLHPEIAALIIFPTMILIFGIGILFSLITVIRALLNSKNGDKWKKLPLFFSIFLTIFGMYLTYATIFGTSGYPIYGYAIHYSLITIGFLLTLSAPVFITITLIQNKKKNNKQ